MADQAQRPDVYEYLDYRLFLNDYYHFKKADRRGFSYRVFSRLAGLSSPNYLKLVIDGARNLSPEMAGRFAEACGLRGEEAAYFQDLVAFNQASTGVERNRQHQRLASFRRYRKVQKLELAHAVYHQTWYLPAIRELASRHDFREDPAWIASVLRPPISEGDAARALETLEALGMLVRDDDGKLVQSEPLVSTGAETRGLHIWNYHRTMMERAAEAMDLFPAHERDISALTLCLRPAAISEVKERIKRFRRELLNLSVEQEQPEQVVQINIQLFPLSLGSGES